MNKKTLAEAIPKYNYRGFFQELIENPVFDNIGYYNIRDERDPDPGPQIREKLYRLQNYLEKYEGLTGFNFREIIKEIEHYSSNKETILYLVSIVINIDYEDNVIKASNEETSLKKLIESESYGASENNFAKDLVQFIGNHINIITGNLEFLGTFPEDINEIKISDINNRIRIVLIALKALLFHYEENKNLYKQPQT